MISSVVDLLYRNDYVPKNLVNPNYQIFRLIIDHIFAVSHFNKREVSNFTYLGILLTDSFSRESFE